MLPTDGVPINKAPSGPTEAMTFPELVANTSTVGDISVTAAALSAPCPHAAAANIKLLPSWQNHAS